MGEPSTDQPRGAVVERALAHAQRAHEGHRVAHGRLVRVGRHDVDVTDGVERLLEREQAAGLDAVVVGDQDARPCLPLGQGSRLPRRGAGRGDVALAGARAHSSRRSCRSGHRRGHRCRLVPTVGRGACRASAPGRRSWLLLGGWIGGRVRARSWGPAGQPPAAAPTAGGVGTRTGRPSRSSTRRAARLVTSRGPPWVRLR